MKTVALLALVFVASCRAGYFDDERDRNIKVEYSFDDDDRREVKFDSDDDRERSIYTRVIPSSPAFISAPARTQYVSVQEAPRAQFRTQFVAVEPPRPVFTPAVQTVELPRSIAATTRFVAAPAPAFAVPVAQQPAVRQYVHVEPAPRPAVATQYVQTQPVASPVVYRSAPQVVSAPVISRFTRPQTSFVSTFRGYDDDSSKEK